MIDPETMFFVSGIVHAVNGEMLTLWINSFDELQTTPIVKAMPRWLLYPEVSFNSSLPCNCIEEESLAGVVWGEFSCTGMVFYSKEESFWMLGRCFEEMTEEENAEDAFDETVLCTVAEQVEMLVSTLVWFFNRGEYHVPETLIQRIVMLEQTLITALAMLPEGWYNKGIALRNREKIRSDFLAERILYCERMAVLLACGLTEKYPTCADEIQKFLLTYDHDAISVLDGRK